MQNNPFIKLLIKLGIINPDKKLAAQLRQPHGLMGNFVGEQMNIGNRGLYDFMFEKVAIANGESVLEIGYGNGNFFKEIFEAAPQALLTGIDFSETMYKAATANAAQFIDDGRLNLHFGSSDAMPFADNSFDKVYCLNVVYFWEQPQKHLQEVLRVLKPGGTFYAGVRTKESMEKISFTRYGFAMYHPHELQEVFAQSGMVNAAAQTFTEKDVAFNGQKIEITSACVQGSKPQ